MREEKELKVDRKKAEHREGLEFEVNSAKDKRTSQPINESGQRLREEDKGKKPLDLTHKESPEPLFLQDNSDGRKGNAQDEKDEMEE